MNALTDVDLRFLTSSQKQKLPFSSQTFVLYYFFPPADAAFILFFSTTFTQLKDKASFGATV